MNCGQKERQWPLWEKIPVYFSLSLSLSRNQGGGSKVYMRWILALRRMDGNGVDSAFYRLGMKRDWLWQLIWSETDIWGLRMSVMFALCPSVFLYFVSKCDCGGDALCSVCWLFVICSMRQYVCPGVCILTAPVPFCLLCTKWTFCQLVVCDAQIGMITLRQTQECVSLFSLPHLCVFRVGWRSLNRSWSSSKCVDQSIPLKYPGTEWIRRSYAQPIRMSVFCVVIYFWRFAAVIIFIPEVLVRVIFCYFR